MNLQYYEPRSGLNSLGRKTPHGIISVEEALRRHSLREPYEVVIGDQAKPAYLVSLSPNSASTLSTREERCAHGNGDWVTVYFIDNKQRWYLQYDFKEEERERLFFDARALTRI